MAKSTKDYSKHAHYLSWLPYNVLYIEMMKLMLIILKRITLKGRLSNSATITKLGIALTKGVWREEGMQLQSIVL